MKCHSRISWGTVGESRFLHCQKKRFRAQRVACRNEYSSSHRRTWRSQRIAHSPQLPQRWFSLARFRYLSASWAVTQNTPKIRDMMKLWTDVKCTDVTLQCREKTFRALKLMLGAASPVFEDMFQEGTKEYQDSDVKTWTATCSTSSRCSWVTCTPIKWTNWMKCTSVNVQSLKEICVQHMATKISVVNALDVLVLAERHGAQCIPSNQPNPRPCDSSAKPFRMCMTPMPGSNSPKIINQISLTSSFHV